MKLGVVTTSYPRWPGDPAGGFVAGHARWLADRGHAVTVVAAGIETPSPGKVRVVRVPDSGNLFYGGGAPEALEAHVVAATFAGVRFTTSLARAVRREGKAWDAIACHWLVPSAAIAAPLTRGPLLAIAHSGDVHVLARRGLLGPTLAALLARGARIVFVAPELHDRASAAIPRLLRGRLDAATLVHPMGLDLARFTAIAAARSNRTPTAKILSLGRLVPVKGIDILLDALALIETPVELVIAGEGPARPALEARAGAIPARHRVRFVGAVGPERRDQLLAAADLFVAPSIVLPNLRSEGTPTAVLEAVAAAVPVVASDAGGLASLPPSWVRTVAAGDPRALAAAITDTLADRTAPARAQSAAAAARVLDWGVVGRRLHEHWLSDYARLDR